LALLTTLSLTAIVMGHVQIVESFVPNELSAKVTEELFESYTPKSTALAEHPPDRITFAIISRVAV
jgi:hypothetical protein